jgi:hypothetical protein
MFAGIEVVTTGATSQQITFDCFAFTQGTSTTYYEPNAVDITLQPVRTNLVPNPSFEVSTSYTYNNHAPSISQDTTSPAFGSKCLKVICDGSGASAGVYPSNNPSGRIPITAGNFYTFSAYVRDGNTNLPSKVSIEWWSATNTSVSSKAGTITPMSTDGWTRLSVTAQAPANAAFATPTVYLQGTASAATYFYVDALLLEATSTLLDYFDGSQAGLEGCAWGGTAGASVSYTYPSSTLKFDRLLKRLPNELPLNTPWRVYTKGSTIPIGQSS